MTIKILLRFFSSSGIGTGSVNSSEVYHKNFDTVVSVGKRNFKFAILQYIVNGTAQKHTEKPVKHLKMECFARIVNSFQRLTIFTKRSILDV